jgi:GNAT superfamily N-acetyltransferase
MPFAPSDAAERSTFDTIFWALDRASRGVIGPARPRLRVIPIRDDAGGVIGGLWGISTFQWLHVEILFVPQAMRRQGVGSELMALAETEAQSWGYIGIYLDAFSFQAAFFYQKLGFSPYDVLDDCPPGHQRLLLQKRLDR